MKKKLLILLFSLHLLLIFFQAFWATIDGYWIYHYNHRPNIPILGFLKQNPKTELYYILSGTNTGYGFYGIKTSSKKFFRITYLDSADNVLQYNRHFNLVTTNGASRLEGYASFLANLIADTQIENNDSLTARINSSFFQFKKNYVIRAIKWLGRKNEGNIANCTAYKVELLTVIPKNIWHSNHKKQPDMYVIQEGFFRVQ